MLPNYRKSESRLAGQSWPNAKGITKGKCARVGKGERGAAGIGRHLSILLAKRFNVYSVASCLNICGIFAKTTKCHAHTHGHAHVAFTSRPPRHQGIGYLTRTACLKFSNTQIVGKLNENILRLAFDWGTRNVGGMVKGECWRCKLLCGIKTAASSGQQTAEKGWKASKEFSRTKLPPGRSLLALFCSMHPPSLHRSSLPPYGIPNQDV